MENHEISITLKKLIKLIDQNIELVWQFVRSNYGILFIIITLLGGFIQFARIIFISPAATPYYSAKQGIIDGLLFVVFLSIIATLTGILYFVFLQIAMKSSQALRIILVIATLIMNITIVYLLYKIELLWFGLFISSLLMFLPLVLLAPELLLGEEKILDDDQNWMLTNRKIKIAYFVAMYLIVSLSGYYDFSKEFNQLANRKIENYTALESKLHGLGYKDFNVVYSNGEYLFLSGPKNRCLVVDVSIVTKDIFEPQQTVKNK